MKHGFYPKLALTGISKNRRLYLPYILTCAGMVMMFYIVSFLSVNQTVRGIPGGDTMQTMLSMGCGVIGVFSLIFLFYTNSFLMRRRKKEFGLYNILGMGKRHLALVLLCECLIVAGISLAGGLLCGILFSKLGELAMIRILDGSVSFSFTVDIRSITTTLALFGVIFLLILLNSLRQIHLANPIELLRSESVGEKPPKANWALALAGVLLLGAAYYLAVTIEDPVSALVWFFVAVVLVIVATYLLFTAGSVALCRLLQKSKRYYYKTNHFVSVSSMKYRMKRNGAGLASICILSTMVLVMLSSTVCLYIGTEDTLRTRYTRDIMTDIPAFDEEAAAAVRETAQQALETEGLSAENLLQYRVLETAAFLDGQKAAISGASAYSFQLSSYSNARLLFLVSLEDYNRLAGVKETLETGQALLYSARTSYDYDTIEIESLGAYAIQKTVPKFVDNSMDAMQVLPSLFLVVPDLAECQQALAGLADEDGEPLVGAHEYYGFDLDCDDETQRAVFGRITEALRQRQIDDSSFPAVSCESVAQEKSSFYSLYGGLFFLGILLGIVFVFAAVLIMYYKQVSEGYEDQSRFAIMQKVGMTRREIQKSINSQVLTVFFLPLLMAGVHTAFAFPLVSKLLSLFNLVNIPLLILVTVGCYLVFALFYVVVYRITSRSYYRIVSDADQAKE
ncbi:MAG TPA: ABC transporter permease [Firmicutes bacterium]|nr:ABC transporter permease [Bacillota bacterium]